MSRKQQSINIKKDVTTACTYVNIYTENVCTKQKIQTPILCVKNSFHNIADDGALACSERFINIMNFNNVISSLSQRKVFLKYPLAFSLLHLHITSYHCIIVVKKAVMSEVKENSNCLGQHKSLQN